MMAGLDLQSFTKRLQNGVIGNYGFIKKQQQRQKQIPFGMTTKRTCNDNCKSRFFDSGFAVAQDDTSW